MTARDLDSLPPRRTDTTPYSTQASRSCLNTEFVPIGTGHFADDYKCDRFVYALGNNCNVSYDNANMEIQTTMCRKLVQNR